MSWNGNEFGELEFLSGDVSVSLDALSPTSSVNDFTIQGDCTVSLDSAFATGVAPDLTPRADATVSLDVLAPTATVPTQVFDPTTIVALGGLQVQGGPFAFDVAISSVSTELGPLVVTGAVTNTVFDIPENFISFDSPGAVGSVGAVTPVIDATVDLPALTASEIAAPDLSETRTALVELDALTPVAVVPASDFRVGVSVALDAVSALGGVADPDIQFPAVVSLSAIPATGATPGMDPAFSSTVNLDVLPAEGALLALTLDVQVNTTLTLGALVASGFVTDMEYVGVLQFERVDLFCPGTRNVSLFSPVDIRIGYHDTGD